MFDQTEYFEKWQIFIEKSIEYIGDSLHYLSERASEKIFNVKSKVLSLNVLTQLKDLISTEEWVEIDSKTIELGVQFL